MMSFIVDRILDSLNESINQPLKDRITKPIYVFRLGKKRELRMSNGANSLGLAHFLINEFDRDYTHQRELGDTILLFKVDLMGREIGGYDSYGSKSISYSVPVSRPAGDGVGAVIKDIYDSGDRVIWWSFGEGEGRLYKSKLIKHIKQKDLQNTPAALKFFKDHYEKSKIRYEKELELYNRTGNDLEGHPFHPAPASYYDNLGYYGSESIASIIRGHFGISKKDDLTIK